MRNDWTYPVEIRRERDGAYHGYASALPEAIAAGRTEEEALEEMRQALVAAVRGRINHGMELAPPPELDGARNGTGSPCRAGSPRRLPSIVPGRTPRSRKPSSPVASAATKPRCAASSIRITAPSSTSSKKPRKRWGADSR